MRAAAVVAVVLASGCARTTPTSTASTATLEPIAGFDAAFAGVRGHRRILALVSPN
jgi:hypothetical protein